MKIYEAVVHRIDKKRQEPAALKLRADLLPVDHVLESTVVKTRQAYNDNPNRAYGVFHADQLAYPFSKALEDYYAGRTTLLDFSGAAMGLLVKEMNQEPLATGGYVIFVSYEENARTFFMVVLLKLKGATGIDEASLALSELWNLDVDHLHEAARINVSNWQAGEGNYISFARKGSGNKKFTEYFRDFIGCDEFVESRAQTATLIRVIKEYCTACNMTPEEAKTVKAKAYDYFVEQSKAKKPINLAAISMRFDDQNPKAFVQYLEEKQVELSDGFEPDKTTYKQLKRIGGKDLDLTINFDRSLLGNRIKYDPDTQQLVITKLPPALIAELEDENS